MEHAALSIETPIGQVLLEARGGKIRHIRFVQTDGALRSSMALDACSKQIAAYFRGELQMFTDIDIAMEGTVFQASVWEEALHIPYGKTCTYRHIAEAIGRPGAMRAVGDALRRNPLPILVPCHRIVPASGGIGGFSAGAWRKAWLLDHEKAHL
ncbi:methylated-DNA--[protein]-cysteine S-methyltransferase [Candidatus Peribacteria bacterium]|nr:methylated-DNA--[protein]-cysteine S-methyltransferase [Candidatus Peribacteria bacterium]